jgi:hypothetical protein
MIYGEPKAFPFIKAPVFLEVENVTVIDHSLLP